MDRLSVLLIDDNPIDLLVNGRVLQNAFGDVEMVQKQSALEALSWLKVQEQWPDVILLDIKMPLMNGFEFLEVLNKEVSKIARKTKIFMVSSSIDPEDISRAASDESIVDFLRKPLKVQDVKAHLP